MEKKVRIGFQICDDRLKSSKEKVLQQCSIPLLYELTESVPFPQKLMEAARLTKMSEEELYYYYHPSSSSVPYTSPHNEMLALKLIKKVVHCSNKYD
jgi:hypothetical protein